MMKKRLLLYFVALCVLATGVACSSKPSKLDQETNQVKEAVSSTKTSQTETEPVTIGAILALTGPYAVHGSRHQQGIEIAVKEINEKGGINGRLIKAIYEDNRGDPKTAIAAFRKLVDLDKVPVVLTTFTGLSYPLIPIADEVKTILMAVNIQSLEFGVRSPWAFRIGINVGIDADTIANYATAKLELKSASIFHENSEFGLDGKKAFTESFTKLGGKILRAEAYDRGVTDYSTQILKLKNDQPQSVYIVGAPSPEIDLIVKQMAEQNFNTQILTNSSIERAEFLKFVGNAANGILYTTPEFNVNDPRIAEVIRKYATKLEMMDYNVALFYDSVHVLAEALARAGTVTPSSLKEALLKPIAYNGLTGKTSFNNNRDALKPVIIKTIKNNQFTIN